jgi:acyl dehydratase
MDQPADAILRGKDALLYEDLVPGLGLESDSHVIDRAEMVSFAQIWDPLPFHVDEEAGRAAFGGLTAPGLYVLAVKQRLIHSLPAIQVIASLGYDDRETGSGSGRSASNIASPRLSPTAA